MPRFTCLQRIVFCILLIVLIAPSGHPQASSATISGTVRDQTSAVIPSATVTLTNQNTNVASKTTANNVGFYIFPGTPPGPYVLVVEATGMQKFEGSLVVQVQQSAVVDITMKVGQTSVEVAVADLTPLV